MQPLGAVQTGVVAGQGRALDPRLAPAAHEFEACLMKEFLQPLQNQGAFGDDTEEKGGDSEDALMSFGSEALAKAISERGGFGIADKIIRHFRDPASVQGGGAAVKTFSETDQGHD